MRSRASVTANQFLSVAMPGLVIVLTLAALITWAPTLRRPGRIDADSAFMREAAIGGLMVVELGRLAQRKGASLEVRQFGERIVVDYSRVNQQLATVAGNRDAGSPATLDPDQRTELETLSAKSGTDFDRASMSSIVTNHLENVRRFQDEAAGASSSEVRGFAAKTLPVLREQLSRAKELADRVGADTAASTVGASAR